MQFPVFMLLFMAPVYVPQALLVGWVSHVARVNPITLILNTNRDFLAGLQAEALLTYGVAFGLMVADGGLGRDRDAAGRDRRLAGSGRTPPSIEPQCSRIASRSSPRKPSPRRRRSPRSAATPR